MRYFVMMALLTAFVATVGQTQETNVAMIPVRYEGLKQEILKQRGKVLLVDFWAGFCPPCRKAFPQFIALQKKYAEQGFVVISVSVDNAQEQEQVEVAQKFLRQVNPPFLNLHLHESAELWTKKLDCSSLPCYYLFDRQGKWIRFGGRADVTINYDDLESVVVRMLNEK
jgi:thiol-disulfide isomerase/thioredoxin